MLMPCLKWRYHCKAGVLSHWLHLSNARHAVSMFHIWMFTTATMHECSYKTVRMTEAMSVQVAEVQELIRQVGLAPTKAKNICNMSKVNTCNVLLLYLRSPLPSLMPRHSHECRYSTSAATAWVA